jgi:hypothetical protein
MSDAQLEAARPLLLSIPVEDVESPAIPIAVVLQEASDLHTLLRESHVWQRLGAVGAKEADRDALQAAIGVARAAQSAWTVTRDRSKSAGQKEREERGHSLRAELLAAARWNLRTDRAAQGTLSAIAEGEGVADLIQDLHDLAELIELKRPAFAADTTFDVPARIEAARSLSSELAAGTSAERLDTNQALAVDLRNRAYTQLAGLVSALRDAGRYAFLDEPDVRKRFASPFTVSRGRRQRAAAAARRVNASAPEA